MQASCNIQLPLLPPKSVASTPKLPTPAAVSAAGSLHHPAASSLSLVPVHAAKGVQVQQHKASAWTGWPESKDTIMTNATMLTILKRVASTREKAIILNTFTLGGFSGLGSGAVLVWMCTSTRSTAAGPSTLQIPPLKTRPRYKRFWTLPGTFASS